MSTAAVATGGRPRAEEDGPTIARDFRWFLAHTLGSSCYEIGQGESPPVDISTVSRGIRRARRRIAGMGLLTVLERIREGLLLRFM